MTDRLLRIEAEWFFDGTTRHPWGAVLCRNGVVETVGATAEVPCPEGSTALRFPGVTLLPGMVDAHVHTTMPGDGTPVEQCAAAGEAMGLLRGTANCRIAVQTGTTTAAECGAPGMTAYALKQALREGIILGPRLFVSGRAMTVTGGHGCPFGGEADGVDGVRRQVRQLFKEGADFIKVMASGGSTLRTRRDIASFSLEELRAIVDEAHGRERRVVAHACNSEAIRRSLAAGVDVIAHCAFTRPEPRPYVWPEEDGPNADFGTYEFQTDLAAEIAARGLPVCPTMCTHRIRIRRLERLGAERGLEPREAAHLDYLRARYAERCAYVRRLRDMGVPLIAGTDSGWGPPFGSMSDEVGALGDAGLSALEALTAATGASAQALGLDHVVGVLAPGRLADLLLVDGNATEDLTALARVRAVYVGGIRVDGVAGDSGR